MTLQVVLFFLALGKVFAQIDMNRDGLIASVPGYSISYYSARWEPLCGTMTAAPTALLDQTTICIPAIERYTNDTTSTLSFYDAAGVKLTGIGVGMGTALCMCFSMASTSVSYDMCWSFNSIGQYFGTNTDSPYGSYRVGAKALPQCGSVDVTALEAQWTRTAVMPTATGPVETFNLPTTATVTETLTPTLVNLTISSSTVVTDAHGSLTTKDLSYTTTAALINFPPDDDDTMSLANRIALGVGLGVGIPAILVGLVASRWPVLTAARARRRPQRDLQLRSLTQDM